MNDIKILSIVVASPNDVQAERAEKIVEGLRLLVMGRVDKRSASTIC